MFAVRAEDKTKHNIVRLVFNIICDDRQLLAAFRNDGKACAVWTEEEVVDFSRRLRFSVYDDEMFVALLRRISVSAPVVAEENSRFNLVEFLSFNPINHCELLTVLLDDESAALAVVAVEKIAYQVRVRSAHSWADDDRGAARTLHKVCDTRVGAKAIIILADDAALSALCAVKHNEVMAVQRGSVHDVLAIRAKQNLVTDAVVEFAGNAVNNHQPFLAAPDCISRTLTVRARPD